MENALGQMVGRPAFPCPLAMHLGGQKEIDHLFPCENCNLQVLVVINDMHHTKITSYEGLVIISIKVIDCIYIYSLVTSFKRHIQLIQKYSTILKLYCP